MADWSQGYVAVDWGTTNRRAYLIEDAGTLLDDMEDDLGVTSVAPGGFEQAVGEIRQRLGDRPMLLAGMIGSNRGWREAPYVPCPAGAKDLAGELLWTDDRTAIVPGLSNLAEGRADVMRGEEVQAFGLAQMAGFGGSVSVCHPGTHTKWMRLSEGRVIDFRTIMTGELFGLLREHSILAPLLQLDTEVGDSFLTGVDVALAEGALSAELFGVRAKVLLAQMAEADASSYTSGLLIGCDMRAGMAMAESDEIVVLGRPTLTKLYAAALRSCGRKPREVDGAAAFVSGIHAVRAALS